MVGRWETAYLFNRRNFTRSDLHYVCCTFLWTLADAKSLYLFQLTKFLTEADLNAAQYKEKNNRLIALLENIMSDTPRFTVVQSEESVSVQSD